jgi:hypothetical protein
MPVDFAAYKKNSVESRPNHGAAMNSARQVDPKYFSKGVPRFYTMDRRPMEKGRAAMTAQTQRPLTTAPGCHVDTEEYFGIAGAVGHNVAAGDPSRNKTDANPALALTNVTGERHGLGGYVVADFDNTRVISQQREHGSTTGGVKHFVSAGTTQPSDAPQTTVREQLHHRTNGFAAAAPVIRGARVQCTNKQLLKESKRGSQVVNTYVTAPQRTAEYKRAKLGDDLLVEQRCVPMAVRADTAVGRQMSHPQASVMYMNQALPGASSTANRNRLPEQNQFQDFTLARDSVKDNDLHIRIN